MKKIIALLLVMIMVGAMAVGCSNTKTDEPTNEPTVNQTETPTTEPVVDNTEGTVEGSDEGSEEGAGEGLTETEMVLNNIISSQPMQFPTMVMAVDMTDEFALESYTGLKSAEHVVEASFCEAMMGSQAFSIVLVKVDDAANAETIANEIKENVNPRKWICVEADDLMVAATGDLVLLAMMDSEYAADATAQSTVDLFATQCGELTVTLGGE